MHQINYQYTNKSISAWGGLRLVQELYERSGLAEKIRELNYWQPDSNRGYEPYQVVEGFLVSVILGSKRFTHSGMLRLDEVVQKIFGWNKGMASQSTFSRFFRKYTFEDNDEHMLQVNKWWFEQVPVDKHTLDFDSSVISRFGQQQGAEVGYNPRRRGRKSHHPIMAFSAESKMVVQAWMRTGDSASCTDFKEFLDETLKVLPKEKIGMLRLDSGFSAGSVLTDIEKRELQYIAALPMRPKIVDQIFQQHTWRKISDGLDCCSFMYQAHNWKTARRIVVVRKDQNKRPNAGGKSLFADYDAFAHYRYSAYITNSNLSAELVWDIYRKRADAENQIKELKYDYGMEGFCSKSMEATEAAFRWVMVAYNLMSLFKQKVIASKAMPTLSTLRFQCIAIGSYIITKSRKQILVLSAKEKKRDYLESLFVNLRKERPLIT